MFTVMHENMAREDFLVQEKMAIIILVIFRLGVNLQISHFHWRKTHAEYDQDLGVEQTSKGLQSFDQVQGRI